MKRFYVILFLAMLMKNIGSYAQDTTIFNAPMIIPEPVKVELTGGYFLLNGESVILPINKKTKNQISFLRGYLSQFYGLELKRGKKNSKSNYIELIIDERVSAKEGAYTLSVTSDKIIIRGYNEQGLFYGVQTLIQLLPVEGNCMIPCVKIEDEPRFEYRGMHLDVVRHIFPINYIKKYIDYLALHKMNYFHWHLTDDQGWRMESKSHPKLNEYGAYRDGTIIGLFPGTGVDSTRYGGFYTIKEMKEVVKYAAKRYITVVPEIDIPGHSMAILAAYPEFGTEPDRVVKPAITWGIYNRQNNVLAPSEPMFEFLEDVFNELMDVFPGKYIHIGADECAHKWWKTDPETQAFIKDHNLKDENGLQRYFAMRISEVIKARGREVVGWDEIIDNGLIEGMIPMVWRNEKNAYKAINQGHKVIFTPMNYSYLNAKQKDKEDSLAHPMRTIKLDRVYNFEPVPDSLSKEEASLVLGGQGCMWTEYYDSPQRVDYAIFPRISALSEVYWSSKEKKNLQNFLIKIPKQLERYRLWGVNYFK
ncbi:MAG: beta-N-acetylhexosaminidase [Bacteroidales bacterium]